jgi:poly(3-hydroxyalkanoate) synthetase
MRRVVISTGTYPGVTFAQRILHPAAETRRNLAITPGTVVFQTELFQLIQYAATTETVLKRPLLIVPPWINKFYIRCARASRPAARLC